jgi:hypothetical protein
VYLLYIRACRINKSIDTESYQAVVEKWISPIKYSTRKTCRHPKMLNVKTKLRVDTAIFVPRFLDSLTNRYKGKGVMSTGEINALGRGRSLSPVAVAAFVVNGALVPSTCV